MAETPNLMDTTPELPSCIHHWLLNEPEAGMIAGRCKRCGLDRLFPARPEGLDRFDDYAPAESPAMQPPAVHAERQSA